MFVDTVLAVGLQSALLLFTAVTDAVQWIMQQEGHHGQIITLMIFLPSIPTSPECRRIVSIMRQVLEETNIRTR